MKLLNSYDNKSDAEQAIAKILGEKRLASERDGTETIYNLFGEPTWTNFFKLEMFQLKELKRLLNKRNSGELVDDHEHKQIISM